MTITDAIVKVLTENVEGLTVKEIYQKILENRYYEFGAKDPIGVVSVQLKRFCEGTNISNPSILKLFVSFQQGNLQKYKLNRKQGETMGTTVGYNYIKTVVNDVEIFTFVMKVNELANISYVAVRGQDTEEGAVQRVLNKQRISSIKNYVLEGNMFVNTFVLNWTNIKQMPVINKDDIEIPIVFSSAQLIDGQHRLEGLKLAMQEDSQIAEKSVIVSMAINLATKDAAKIFLNINSEQKPVPKSLIYDLYGITDEDRNYAINRANDIANMLNDDVNSPYYRAIKFPGAPRGKGKLDLSTVITGIKGYIDRGGKFEENNIRDLNLQYNIILNYFSALKYHADKSLKWSTVSQNIFFKAAGYIGAIEFFFSYVFPKCVTLKSFKQETIVGMFDFKDVELITPKSIESTDGRTARKRVMDNLKDAFISDVPGESEYDI